MAFEKIIVLDDEMIIRKTLEQQLRKKHYAVATASRIAEAEALLVKDQFDLIFVDVRLPDGDGTQLLERLAEDPDSPLVVMITGYGSIENAVECMRKGAFDYIVKPCSIEEIDVILKKAEDYSQQVKLNRYFSDAQLVPSEIIGASSKLTHLRTMIKKVAATEATVLITGENGTGKELVASELFRLSPRAGRPYIKVNCAAVSETLIESEFFGHERGAFTGANQRREGRFELANGGTILLDEIAEIPPRLQAKLLRVLQEREFERVGGNRTIQVDVRVLATTNRDLLSEVQKGNFREDLFYRLNVFPVLVPALRERPDDIPLLAQAFLERFCRKHGVKLPGFSASCVEVMMRHRWPGNVRELQNTIERAVILADEGQPVQPDCLGIPGLTAGPSVLGAPATTPTVSIPPTPVPVTSAFPPAEAVAPAPTAGISQASSLPGWPVSEPSALSEKSPAAPLIPLTNQGDNPADSSAPIRPDELAAPASPGAVASPVSPVEPGSPFQSLEELEKAHILQALEHTQGKRVEAAEMLGISTRTLRNKINQYRLEGTDVP